MRRNKAVFAAGAVTTAAVVALVFAGAGWWLAHPPHITSLAVKPFNDLSGDTGQAHLSDGMTDALCISLADIGALRVPGRSSVMRFKGTQKSVPEMARELNVDAVVEGSIQRDGTRLRINVQLVAAATDRQLWAHTYDRELSDFFTVQSEVAKAIAAEIQVRLTSEDQARLARARTAKPETIEACLLGLRCWWEASEKSTINAIRYFQRAIEIEPDYAPAHAGLALSYIYASTFVGIWEPREGVPKGKAAAQRAIELDPMLADAYVALGFARMNYDWDWAGAEKDFKRAIELNPRSSVAQDGYASFLALRGRFDEGIKVLQRALEFDPLSPGLYHDLGWILRLSGQCDKAIPPLLQAIELNRSMLNSRTLLGVCYLDTGKTMQALSELKAVVQLAPDWPWPQSFLGYAYALSGHREEARGVLADLDQLAKKRYVAPSAQATVYAGLGQTDAALDLLEQAYAQRHIDMAFLKVEPVCASLRGDPRFQALAEKVENGGRGP